MLNLKSKVPPPITLSKFLLNIRTDLKKIECILNKKDDFYGYFEIPKKKGGTRPITPALKELKTIQGYTKKFLDSCIEWPKYMHGGIRGRSVLTNAKYHVKRYMVVNVDIEKCFPNTSYDKVYTALIRFGCEKELALLLSDICTFKDCLPQGASTSTCIANLVLESVDRTLLTYFKKHNLYYTRFVDDITLSGDVDLRPFENVFRNSISAAQYSISKYSVAGRSEAQIVTGLRVNDKIRPTREFLVQLKDDIKAGWPENNHLELIANERGLTLLELRNNVFGRINFVRSVDNKLGRQIRGLLTKVVWPRKNVFN